jgi:hypothetical protein
MKKQPAFPIHKTIILSVAFYLITSHSLSVASYPQIPANTGTSEIRHLDLTYNFTAPDSREKWIARVTRLRYQILFSAGLLPLPEKTPLNAHIFGKTDRGDFTIEKVYFESFPGHYVTGNLYRPKNVSGKAPGVLLPHGHWQYGRLENQPLNSGPLRAANFAKLGFIAFTWDMVGYNDSTAVPHTFASHKESLVSESLWGVNLLGLQLWNSIRALDFLESLPDVDATRLGVTGESGGGTQTFLLGAVDDRIRVSAPVNMISFTMQGGSVCENAPNLRIDTNNVEIGAMMAPRPMLMVAATGDWTKNTPTSEYPAIKGVYQLFGAEDKLQMVQFDAPHNYHRESREAVYGWFVHWLQGRADYSPIKEKSAGNLALPELLVFYGIPRPTNELDEKSLTASLIVSRQKQLEAALPKDQSSLEAFREQYGNALKFSLMAEYPKPEEITAQGLDITSSGWRIHEPVELSRAGSGDSFGMTLVYSEARQAKDNKYAVLFNSHPESDSLRQVLTEKGFTLASINTYKSSVTDEIRNVRKFLTTYNRTESMQNVQRMLTTIAYLKKRNSQASISVVADASNLWALLARGLAPQIDRMIVDVSGFDNASDEEYLKRVAIPGIRRAGDFLTAIALAPKTPMLIHNTGNRFRTEKLAELYRHSGKLADLQIYKDKLPVERMIEWLTQ